MYNRDVGYNPRVRNLMSNFNRKDTTHEKSTRVYELNKYYFSKSTFSGFALSRVKLKVIYYRRISVF